MPTRKENIKSMRALLLASGSDLAVDIFPGINGPKRPVVDKRLPLCVVDLNAIRASPVEQLPLTFTSLVPQSLLFEWKGMELSRPAVRQGLLAKMRRVLGMNANLFICRHFHDLVEDEIRSGRPTTREDLIDLGENWNLRDHATTQKRWETWMSPEFGSRSVKNFETKRVQFQEMRLLFAEMIKKNSEEFFGPTRPTEIVFEAAREYRCIRAWIHYLYGRDIDLAVWDRRLDQFPDVYAIGRLARVNMAYLLLAWLGHTKKMGNDWEDLEYAFLATFADAIVTDDRRLASVVRNASPSVAVFGRLSEADDYFRSTVLPA